MLAGGTGRLNRPVRVISGYVVVVGGGRARMRTRVAGAAAVAAVAAADREAPDAGIARPTDQSRPRVRALSTAWARSRASSLP